MSERDPMVELSRLEADFRRGALSADEYGRFRAELLGAVRVIPLPAPTQESAVSIRFARWGRRVAAKLVDLLVFGLALLVSFLAVAATADPETGEPSRGAVLVLLLVLVLGPLLYPWLMIGRWGQTVGKMALGVKVVRAGDLQPISYPRALRRAFSEVLLGILAPLLLLSYLWPLWDARRQTLHDKIAGTVVTHI